MAKPKVAKKNSQQATRGRGPGKPFQKGKSGNPKGRPLRGNSYAEVVRELGSMTGEQIADAMCNQWAPELRREIGKVRFMDAFVVRAFMAFMNEPTGAMFNAITDRAEGKPVLTVAGDANRPLRIRVEYVDGEEAQALLRAGEGQG